MIPHRMTETFCITSEVWATVQREKQCSLHTTPKCPNGAVFIHISLFYYINVYSSYYKKKKIPEVNPAAAISRTQHMTPDQ